MEFTRCFPVWDKLTPVQQQKLSEAVVSRHIPKGTVIHRGSLDCSGLLLVQSGQLRAYILSDEGQEITIYRLIEEDICLFSASCVMRNIQFDISIEAEKDTQIWVIPPDVYRALMEESAAVANYTNDLMSSRFSEVMWLIEQVMWRSFDRRLADGRDACFDNHSRENRQSSGICQRGGNPNAPLFPERGTRKVVPGARGADGPEETGFAV